MILLRLLSLSVIMMIPPEGIATGLAERLETLRKQHQVPGLAVVTVDQDGIQQAIELGYADLAERRPMTIDTLTRIGSVTKTFNAIGLLRLEAAGDISLDQTLHEIASELPLNNPWQDAHPVRLIHLVEHTAGLADMTRAEFAHNKPFDSLRAAFDFAPASRRVLWPPGFYPQYSNVGAGYLGYVMEQASGETYEQFMRRQVLMPMGLTSATLQADAQTLQRLATGYDSDGKSVIPYWHMVFPPLGAINATPREMAALPLLFLRRGVIDGRPFLTAKTATRMERPSSSAGARAGLAYGYGLGIEQEIDRDLVWFGHGGDGDGYLSHFAYQKELGVGYFLTFNAFKRDALGDFKRAIQEYLNIEHTSEKLSPHSAGSEVPAGALGDYEPLTYRFVGSVDETTMSLGIRDNEMFLRYASGRHLPLIAVTESLYRHPAEPVATIALTRVEGRWVLQGEFGNYGKR